MIKNEYLVKFYINVNYTLTKPKTYKNKKWNDREINEINSYQKRQKIDNIPHENDKMKVNEKYFLSF